MNSQIATRVLIYAASAMCPLVASKVAHTIALIARGVFATALDGKPLPPLTDVVLIRFASSDLSLGLGLGITIFMLISVVTVANPRQVNAAGASTSGAASGTSQLFLAFVGPFISTLYLGIVLIATLLPLTPMGHVLTKSVEQAEAAHP